MLVTIGTERVKQRNRTIIFGIRLLQRHVLAFLKITNIVAQPLQVLCGDFCACLLLSLQTQFTVIIISGVGALFNHDCKYPTWAKWIMVFYTFTQLALFSNFYVKTYLQNRQSKMADSKKESQARLRNPQPMTRTQTHNSVNNHFAIVASDGL